MIIRTINKQDTDAVKDIWRLCFEEDSDNFVEWYFSKRFDPSRSVGLFDPELKSVLQYAPYRLSIWGQSVDANFIVGVSTRPDEQGKGYMARLLQEAFSMLYKNGQVVSTLYPFNYEFYKKFGYGVFSSNLLCECDNRAQKGGETLTAEQMHKAYNNMAGRFDAYVERNSALCELRLEGWIVDSSKAVGTGDGDYALYYTRNNQTACEEFVYSSEEGFRRLMAILPEGKVKFVIPQRDITLLPETGKCEPQPFGMIRLINLEAALNMMRFEEGEHVISTLDQHCPWNTGTYKIHGGAKTSVEKISSEAGPGSMMPDAIASALMGTGDGLEYCIAPKTYLLDQY